MPIELSKSLLSLIENILSNRFQSVPLNSLLSEWLPVRADVSQGSILGPVFPNLH